jgi:hypothetical protein
VQSGKAHGALNLDAACSGAASLEHFVLFSSLVAYVGNEGGLQPPSALHFPCKTSSLDRTGGTSSWLADRPDSSAADLLVK